MMLMYEELIQRDTIYKKMFMGVLHHITFIYDEQGKITSFNFSAINIKNCDKRTNNIISIRLDDDVIFKQDEAIIRNKLNEAKNREAYLEIQAMRMIENDANNWLDDVAEDKFLIDAEINHEDNEVASEAPKNDVKDESIKEDNSSNINYHKMSFAEIIAKKKSGELK